MRKYCKYMLLIVLIIFASFMLTNCSSPDPLKVALMTKLDPGSLVGKSEVDVITHFVDEYNVTEIVFVPFDDGWDPDRIPEVYEEIRAQGIDVIITSHTSTCAVELKKFTDAEMDDVLVFVTASTTDELTAQKDNNIRVIQDVKIEQTSIADRILADGFENLVIVRDTDNHKYTEPALKYFKESYGDTVVVIDISASDANMVAVEEELKRIEFDAIYTLIGTNEDISGAIAQVAWKLNPDVKVFFTPWSNIPNILSTAGPAIDQCIIASHLPSKTESKIANKFFNSFQEQFDYVPPSTTLHISKAIEIIYKAVNEGNSTQMEIRNWILDKRIFDTHLGEVYLDEYGDTSLGLYFFEDIIKEYE